MKTVLLALALVTAGAWPAAAQPDDSQAVLNAERRWTEALETGDTAALGEIYADDLVYVHSGGNAESKAEFIGRVKAGGLKYESVTLADPKVRLYGDAAVVNGTFDVRVMVDGAPVDTKVVYIHVYARQGGGWRMVAHQTTRSPAQ